MSRLKREQYTVTGKEKLLAGLNLIIRYPNRNYNMLLEVAGKENIAKGGSFNEVVTDLKTMKLATNGLRYTPTELGITINKNPNDKNSLAIAGLNVSINQEYNHNFPGSKEPEHFIRWLIEKYHVKSPLVGRIPRRYMEWIFPEIKLPKKFKIPKDLTKHKTNMKLELNTYQTVKESIKEDDPKIFIEDEVINLIPVIKQLKKKFHKEDIDKLWDKI
jgi:hypothetical protein